MSQLQAFQRSAALALMLALGAPAVSFAQTYPDGAASDPGEAPIYQPEVDEDEDDGSRGFLWLRAMGGFAYTDLVTFSDDNFYPSAESTAARGFTGGLGVGARIYFISIGAQAFFSAMNEFDVATVGVDIALHLPVPLIQPYLRGGLGYAWVGNANYRTPELSDTRVDGLTFDFGLGLDIRLLKFLSLGLGVDGVFLNLTRDGIEEVPLITDVDLEEEGATFGLQVRAYARLTFHIG